MQQVTSREPTSVRAQVLDTVTEVGARLGFEPAVRFSGVFEETLSDTVVHDLHAVLREALTNIAKHADANAATVAITAAADQLVLDVTDDGIGITPSTRRSGLANLARRAERYGETLSVTQRPTSGTRLTWSIPLG